MRKLYATVAALAMAVAAGPVLTAPAFAQTSTPQAEPQTNAPQKAMPDAVNPNNAPAEKMAPTAPLAPRANNPNTQNFDDDTTATATGGANSANDEAAPGNDQQQKAHHPKKKPQSVSTGYQDGKESAASKAKAKSTDHMADQLNQQELGKVAPP
jgi:hypothetical protein